jgi:uncharacterized membrane protein YhaH (DUF805 family)
MNIIQVLKTVFFNKYCVLTGRASRSEYLYAHLFFLILYVFSTIVFPWKIQIPVPSLDQLFEFSVTNIVLSCVCFLPLLGLTTRRLHDGNINGWWTILGLIPFVSLILVYFLIFTIDPNDNKYGEVPKT